MIKIIAKTTVPEEKIAGFIEAAKMLVEQSRAEEGNISYGIFRSQTDPEEVVFIEAWKDQAAIDIHNATPHFTGTVPKLAEFCTSEMIINQYDELI